MSSSIPFVRPDLGEDEIAAVVDVLRSGWLTTGAVCERFEAAFAGSLGPSVSATAVSSATAGIFLALSAAGVGPGDEVIVPAYTFTSTGSAVLDTGARPVLVDSAPGDFALDPDAVARAATPRTRAVIPVHFAGRPAPMQEICAVAERHGLSVIEDAAHAYTATYRGSPIGALATSACVFSLYATKSITTGEGGMVATRDGRMADRIRSTRAHGIDAAAWERSKASSRSWDYNVVERGWKANLPDFAAAMGLIQVRRAQAMRQRRATLAQRYRERLAGLPLLAPPEADALSTHAWHLYVVRLDSGVERDEFVERLARRGIGCSVHFKPLPAHSYWAETLGVRPDAFPHAMAAFERAVSLPLYSGMTDADQDRVIEAVLEILR